MSFAQTYVLASKVRSKLTRDASNANVPLRNLVVQANMLDNLMDHIADENNKRLEKLNQVKFELPTRSTSQLHTEITEYEVSSESDSESEEEYESDSDDYYYSSEEEQDQEDEEIAVAESVSYTPSFKLATIEEMPELTKSDESEESEYSSDEEVYHNSHNLGLNLSTKTLFPRTDVYGVSEVY